MIRHALGCALFLCWASSGNAQQIYKCVSSDSVTYQSAPCDASAASASTFVASAAQSSRDVPSADSTPACAARPEPSSRLRFSASRDLHRDD